MFVSYNLFFCEGGRSYFNEILIPVALRFPKLFMGVDKRLYTLDYLRGLAALAIMAYHYLGWTYGHFDADSFMGRVGVYGVSIFYVLSGLTLYHVYYQSMSLEVRSLKDFFIKRLFRIFPLLWLVMGATLLISKERHDTYELFLNFTGLFSVLEWEEYIGTGVWSIGNELVFYLFFPLFIVLSKRSLSAFYAFCALLFGLYVYFAFFVLQEKQSLSSQWAHFINPLNQVFLFLGGYLIGLWSERWKISASLTYGLFVGAALLFTYYPVEGNVIHLVTDNTRLVFTLLCFILCFSLYKTNLKLPALADAWLKRLGEISYSLYLLHPLVWFVVKAVYVLLAAYTSLSIALEYQLGMAVLLSLLLSNLVYDRYERFFVQAGKKVSGRFVPVRPAL